MPETIEYGYLGSTSIESGTATGGKGTISRKPTLDAQGNPVYMPSAEAAWASELIGADGRYRFAKAGQASGRGANNALDSIMDDNCTVIALARMSYDANYRTIFARGTNGVDNVQLLGLSNSAAQGPVLVIRRGLGAYMTAGGAALPRRLNDWQWVAMTRAGSAIAAFADGKKSTGVDSTPGPLTNPSPIVWYHSGGSQIACGMIFNRVLSDDEITNIMLGKLPPKSVEGLVGYYKFNEVGGSVCIDHSGMGNHFTYTGDASATLEEWSPDGNLARAPVGAGVQWYVPAGCSLSNQAFNFTETAAPGSSFMATADIVTGQSYTVSYDVSGVTGGASIRIMLFAANGASTSTTPQNTDGIGVTQTVKVTGTGAGTFNRIGVQNLNGSSSAVVSNLKVIPVASRDGRSGMPYPARIKRNEGNWWERTPKAIASYSAQCSVASRAGSAPRMAYMPDDFALNGDFAYCAKVKLAYASTIALAYGWGSTYTGIGIYLYDLKRFRVMWADGVSNGTSPFLYLNKALLTNTWMDIQVVRKGNNLSVYVNNVLVASEDFARPYTAVAGGQFYPMLAASGMSRSCRWFNRALTHLERESIFQVDTCVDRTGLIGEWLCNDPLSVFPQDSSGNAYHITNNICPWAMTSPHTMPRRKRIGKQLNMPVGVGTLLRNTNVRAKLDGAACITVSGWIKTDAGLTASGQRIGVNTSADNAGVIITCDPVAKLMTMYARSKADGTSSSVNVPASLMPPFGNWALFSAEANFEKNTISMYVNGVMVATTPATAAFDGLSAYTETGDPQFVVSLGQPGRNNRCDSFRVYSRALTKDEHFSLYMDKAPRDGLAVEWLFDDDQPAVAIDTSGNGIHGGVHGTAKYISEQ